MFVLQQNYWRSSFLNIIINNSVPLLGVFLFDWHVAEVVITFWLQSFIIGLFNVLKMAMAKGPTQNRSRIGLILFFMVHYFMFILGQGFFIIIFVLGGDGIAQAFKMNFPLVLTGITLSIGYSFLNEFILSGQYLQRSADSYFFSPYGRVFIQQILVLGAGYSVARAELDQNTVIIMLLVGLKVFIDLGQLFFNYLLNRGALKTTT